MFPFLSYLLFCPVTPWYENMNFPIPSKSPAHCCTCSPVPRWGRAAALHRDLNSADLESCHVPSQMWKQFRGRLKGFFLPKLWTPINIEQKCILSLFVYSLLNTVMVSSCIAGGSIHWNFTVDFFFFHYCPINVFPPIFLCAYRMPNVSCHTCFLLFFIHYFNSPSIARHLKIIW